MPTRRKLSVRDLRWAAIVVGVAALLATMFSDLGAATWRGGGVAIADASVGHVPLKFVFVVAAALIVGLLYVASRRAGGPDNSN